MKSAIEDELDQGLPRSYTPEVFAAKAGAVFLHVFERFGRSGWKSAPRDSKRRRCATSLLAPGSCSPPPHDRAKATHRFTRVTPSAVVSGAEDVPSWEGAGGDQARSGVVEVESAFKRKLGSRAFGLNAN